MHAERDFDLNQPLPRHERDLTQDLELNTLLTAMADGDEFLFEVTRVALLSGLKNDAETILHRQDILKDSLRNPVTVRQIYGLAIEAIESRRRHYFGIFGRYPSGILSGAIDLLQLFMEILKKLRSLADAQAVRFESRGFTTLFAMLRREFTDEYFARVRDHLTRLKFSAGVLISAGLGKGNAGTNYVLHRPPEKKPGWLRRMFERVPRAYTIYIHPRDETGARILSELRDRGINLAANAVAQSADHILGFFEMLRVELAFYVACLNLHDRLAALGAPTCFPRPAPKGTRRHTFTGLYDLCLALSMGRSVVGNAVDADGRNLVIITGANTGGKSTFLRSIGLAQLMMQCGMFVAAESFAAELCTGLFTHYKRQEDATMKSGKLDEELKRMSEIADAIRPDALLLLNESFASTNEREGSEIARQIVRALLEKRIKIYYVTHLHEFAHGFFSSKMKDVLFLRAERLADGTRTFRLIEGEPMETSYGVDLYRTIFAPGTAKQAQDER